jgi:eukaryotic-like serine/threonine-protein kinase
MSDAKPQRNPIDELAEQFAQRLRRGERPALTEYVRQYPELADEIRELFPALVMMEQLKPTSADDEPATGERPERIDDYRLLREIGRGGMGIVYEAEQISLGRHVALKVLSGDNLTNATYLERFRREAKAAARLHNRNIVPVFEVGENNGVHYYAMQFIRGEGLDKVLNDVRCLRGRTSAILGGQDTINPLTSQSVAQSLLSGRFEYPAAAESSGACIPEPSAPSSTLSGAESEAEYCRSVARVGLQVAEALAYAHKQGILHRDIKPSNLLLDWQGTVWITDFGLAKAEDADELTRTGDIVGTIRYMAPERFEGTSLPQSDVYALGMTLYEMLTLRPAFGDTNRARLMQRILHEEPPPPRRFDPRIPRDLETVVLKAIAHDPRRRYATAEDMAEDLRRFLADRPIQARRSSVLEQMWRWCRRNPAVAGLTAVVGLLLLLIAIGLMNRRPPAQPTSPQTVDALPAGTRWTGPARWLPNLQEGPQITVAIDERNGEEFKGTYIAVEDTGRYVWRIAGTLRQGSIQWRFTEVIEEAQPTRVVEFARVEGKQEGDALDLLYRDDDSSAKLLLRRQE